MLKNLLKVSLILGIVFIVCTSYVYAGDINMNLPNTPDENIDTSNTDNPADGGELENPNEVPVDDENAQTNPEGNLAEDGNVTENLPNSSPTDEDEVLAPSTSSNAVQSGLSVTDIINILLITVGVIIILLSIAILIRLK